MAMSIEDFIKDKPFNLATFRGDPREVETTTAELQRNWIFPRFHSSVRDIQDAKIKVFHPGAHCSDDGDHLVHDWGRLVQNYTARGMTRQTDKLVAIHGIAEAVARTKNIDYLAGIWNTTGKDLVQGLLWSAARPGQKLLDVAPSWSWASIECEVQWPGLLSADFQHTAEILDFQCTGTATRSSGMITCRARVREGIVGPDGKPGLLVHSIRSPANAKDAEWLLPCLPVQKKDRHFSMRGFCRDRGCCLWNLGRGRFLTDEQRF